jgi:pimeloyl-ACP methyl ester carboxylesterase
MLKKILYGIFTLLLILVVVWFSGPRPKFPAINNEPTELSLHITQLDSIINEKESKIEYLKDDNQARIIWADSTHQKTEYSVVYLHGFSASQGEGDPIHKMIAKDLNANLYLARLRDHGISYQQTFRDLTPGQLVDDAKEAIAIGRIIGDKVIVISCSTGGTLSIYLAAADPSIISLVLLSPNIAINTSGAEALTGPWGKQVLLQLAGEYRNVPKDEESDYWTGTYHNNGLIALQSLIDQSMTDEIFKKINIPIFMGYYYKNEIEKDQVVSVDAMLHFFDSINTPTGQKMKVAFEDAGNHVICSQYSNKNWEKVYVKISEFLINLINSQSL